MLILIHNYFVIKEVHGEFLVAGIDATSSCLLDFFH